MWLTTVLMTKGQTMRSVFHLAYNVSDLDQARAFYGELLGAKEGRSTETWVDFDFFGHQISLHLGTPFETADTGKVGDHMVPMPHLGVVLELPQWRQLADRLQMADVAFVIPPSDSSHGHSGEQGALLSPSPFSCLQIRCYSLLPQTMLNT
mgnify:CR=1 FL=1